MPATEIRAQFPDAALVHAHPYRHRLDYEEGRLRPPAIDAVEIFSANHSMKANSRGLEDWHRHRYTAVAGTDAHGRTPAGSYPTQFDHPVGDIEELAAEIRRGRCRPLFKEITHAGANALVTEIVIGTKGEFGQRPRIILRRIGRRSEWPKALRTATLTCELVAHGFAGGRFRLPALVVWPETAVRGLSIDEDLLGRSFLRIRAKRSLERGPVARGADERRRGREIGRASAAQRRLRAAGCRNRGSGRPRGSRNVIASGAKQSDDSKMPCVRQMAASLCSSQ
jgi:hypothetical protein